MKLNINWKELGIQLLKAIWPVLAGALTGATVVTATGCTSMATQPRGQTTKIIHDERKDQYVSHRVQGNRRRGNRWNSPAPKASGWPNEVSPQGRKSPSGHHRLHQ